MREGLGASPSLLPFPSRSILFRRPSHSSLALSGTRARPHTVSNLEQDDRMSSSQTDKALLAQGQGGRGVGKERSSGPQPSRSPPAPRSAPAQTQSRGRGGGGGSGKRVREVKRQQLVDDSAVRAPPRPSPSSSRPSRSTTAQKMRPLRRLRTAATCSPSPTRALEFPPPLRPRRVALALGPSKKSNSSKPSPSHFTISLSQNRFGVPGRSSNRLVF